MASMGIASPSPPSTMSTASASTYGQSASPVTLAPFQYHNAGHESGSNYTQHRQHGQSAGQYRQNDRSGGDGGGSNGHHHAMSLSGMLSNATFQAASAPISVHDTYHHSHHRYRSDDFSV